MSPTRHAHLKQEKKNQDKSYIFILLRFFSLKMSFILSDSGEITSINLCCLIYLNFSY